MQIAGFDWDQGNVEKCQAHGISIEIIEAVFEAPVVILPDLEHSQNEERLRAIGRDACGRHVFVVFTVRRTNKAFLLRPISARYMHRKEVAAYEEAYPKL